MRVKIFLIYGVLLFLPRSLQGQVVVINPNSVTYSREQVVVAYDIARRQVIQELFPNEKVALPGFQVTLKLGCKDPVLGTEYVDTGWRQGSQSSVVCMRDWDLEKFSYALIRIIQSRLISEQKRDEIMENIVRRVQLTTPVNASELQNKR